jgi:hypothetical protein
MRNYFLGVIAVLLAITFSAFSVTDKPSNTGDLYWYPVSGGITTGGYVFFGTEANAKTMSCPDSISEPVCLFGDESSTLATSTSVGTDETRLIREPD